MNRYHSIKDSRIRNRRKQLFIRARTRANLDLFESPRDEEVAKEVENLNMRKKHPFSCGRKNCTICHPEKVFNIKKKIELIEDYRTQEQLREI